MNGRDDAVRSVSGLRHDEGVVAPAHVSEYEPEVAGTGQEKGPVRVCADPSGRRVSGHGLAELAGGMLTVPALEGADTELAKVLTSHPAERSRTMPCCRYQVIACGVGVVAIQEGHAADEVALPPASPEREFASRRTAERYVQLPRYPACANCRVGTTLVRQERGPVLVDACPKSIQLAACALIPAESLAPAPIEGADRIQALSARIEGVYEASHVDIPGLLTPHRLPAARFNQPAEPLMMQVPSGATIAIDTRTCAGRVSWRRIRPVTAADPNAGHA